MAVGHPRSSSVASPNIRFVGHSDQGGKSDGVQVMVHRGHAFIGHTFSNGITIVDVRDPSRPRTVEFIACPPNTRAVHIQTHEDLLLAVNGPSVWHMQEFQNLQDYFEGSPADKLKERAGSFASGIRMFDISRPECLVTTPPTGGHSMQRRTQPNGGASRHVASVCQAFS